jgi:hypothetical protein
MWEPIRRWLDESKHARSVFIAIFTATIVGALGALLIWAQQAGHSWIVAIAVLAGVALGIKYWDA